MPSFFSSLFSSSSFFCSLISMPLFFFLSGLVYNNKAKGYSDSIIRIRKDFFCFFIPYCTVVALIGIFLLIIQSRGDKGYYDSINDLLKSAIFGSGCGYNGIKLIGEIWFLLAMFWSRRIMDTVFLFQNLKYRFLIILSLIGIGVSLAGNKIWIPLNIDIACVAVGFMYAGWLVKQKQDIIDHPYMLCSILMVSVISITSTQFGMADRNYSFLWFISIPGAIALSILSCYISKLIEKTKCFRHFLSFIGKHSLLFICIHSLDWRIPFQKFGQSFVSTFSNTSYYWAIKFAHRFLFDLLFTCIVVLFINLLHSIKKKMTMHSKATVN